MNPISTFFPQQTPQSHAATNSSSSSDSSSTDGTNNTPSNQLNPDDFITLLATQLQAQDPLNPLDPTQMVNELTTMNTFEQLLQIRQDMDTLVGAANSATGGGSGTPANVSIAPNTQAALNKALSSNLAQSLLSSQQTHALNL
jgi:flagellar basal-body rod modification protein FlgD